MHTERKAKARFKNCLQEAKKKRNETKRDESQAKAMQMQRVGKATLHSHKSCKHFFFATTTTTLHDNI